MQPGNSHNMPDAADPQGRFFRIGEVRCIPQQQRLGKGRRVLREAVFHSLFGRCTQALGKIPQAVFPRPINMDRTFRACKGENTPAIVYGVFLGAARQSHLDLESPFQNVPGLRCLPLAQVSPNGIAFSIDLHLRLNRVAVLPRHTVGLGDQCSGDGLPVQRKQRRVTGSLQEKQHAAAQHHAQQHRRGIAHPAVFSRQPHGSGPQQKSYAKKHRAVVPEQPNKQRAAQGRAYGEPEQSAHAILSLSQKAQPVRAAPSKF